MAIINRSQKESDKKPTRYYSNIQEKQVAKSLSGRQTKNSGATKFDKSDVILDNFNVECKTKTAPSESISIKKEWLEKTLQETLLTGKKYSALAFNFGPNQKNYYIIDEYLFSILNNYLNNKND